MTREEFWTTPIHGVNACDRLLGIDLYMPSRVWEQPLKACGGQSRNEYPAWQYLSNVDHRCAKLEGEVAQLKQSLKSANDKLDKIIKALAK